MAKGLWKSKLEQRKNKLKGLGKKKKINVYV